MLSLRVPILPRVLNVLIFGKTWPSTWNRQPPHRNRNPCSQLRQPYYQFQTRMDSVLSLVIHEILPTEILEMIFEEHAKLEWRAPTIDGQVCRFWRETVLNTPRVWAYFIIRQYYVPSTGELRLRLHRSRTAPLHIDTRAAGLNACQKLYNLFSDYHTRIASLRAQYSSQCFFQG